MPINPITWKENTELWTTISWAANSQTPANAQSIWGDWIGWNSWPLKVDVNKINEYRQSSWMSSLQATPIPVEPPSTVSNVSGGFNKLQEKTVPIPNQSAAAITPTTTEPKTPATWVSTAPVATWENADTQAQKIIDNIFSTNNLSQDEKNWWNTNVFNTPQERQKFLQMTDTERQNYISNINEANKLTRDASLKADYEKQAFDRKMADAQAQSELERNKMKAEIEAQTNNFAMAQGTSGRLQSRNLQSAINQQLDLSKQTYDNLVATQVVISKHWQMSISITIR